MAHYSGPQTLLQKLQTWSIHPPGLASEEELTKERFAAATPSLEFTVLLITSAVIATLGLVSNSPAVVIGAMIVAPLMDPILSLAFGIAIGHRQLILKASALIALGVGLVVATSAGLTQLLSVDFVDQQIVSRTNPNLIDMLVAIAAGTVGAFVQSRRSLLNSLAGVAIAVALVPPLCVTGIGVNQSETITVRLNQAIVPNLQHHVAGGSFLLFITNLVGIAAAGVAVFLVQRYGNPKRCLPYLLSWLVLLVVICMPLSTSLQDFTARHNVESSFILFQKKQINAPTAGEGHQKFWDSTTLAYVDAKLRDKKLKVSLVLEGPSIPNTKTVLKEAYGQLKEELARQGNFDLEARMSFIPANTYVFEDTN